jgi:hypothetical protein
MEKEEFITNVTVKLAEIDEIFRTIKSKLNVDEDASSCDVNDKNENYDNTNHGSLVELCDSDRCVFAQPCCEKETLADLDLSRRILELEGFVNELRNKVVSGEKEK